MIKVLYVKYMQYEVCRKEKMILYSKYEELLKKTGKNSFQVSKATGIGQNTLSNWKTGRSNPKADKLKILADYFGVSIDYLACGEKASVISVDGLTDEQVDLVTELARSLQQQNKNHRVTPKSTPTPEQQELVFKVIEQFLK